MTKKETTRQLEAQLASMRKLCGHQLRKIQDRDRTIRSLEARIERLIATVARHTNKR